MISTFCLCFTKYAYNSFWHIRIIWITIFNRRTYYSISTYSLTFVSKINRTIVALFIRLFFSVSTIRLFIGKSLTINSTFMVITITISVVNISMITFFIRILMSVSTEMVSTYKYTLFITNTI